MKPRKFNLIIYPFLLFSILLINGCRGRKVTFENCDQISRLKIINRTGNTYISDSVQISDKNAIKDFCDIIYNRSFYGEANLKSNFGYYQVIVFFTDKTHSSYDVIYTVFEGVIIVDPNHDNYKNNEMDSFILNQFQRKREK